MYLQCAVLTVSRYKVNVAWVTTSGPVHLHLLVTTEDNQVRGGGDTVWSVQFAGGADDTIHLYTANHYNNDNKVENVRGYHCSDLVAGQC